MKIKPSIVIGALATAAIALFAIALWMGNESLSSKLAGTGTLLLLTCGMIFLAVAFREF